MLQHRCQNVSIIDQYVSFFLIGAVPEPEAEDPEFEYG